MGRRVTPRIAALVLALLIVVGALTAYATLGGRGPAAPPGSSAPPPPGASASSSGTNGATPAGTGTGASPVATQSGPARVRALASREVFGFLPYWKLGGAETQVPLDVLTTVAIFGVEAGKDGSLVRQTAAGGTPPGWKAWQSAAADDVIARAKAAHVRVVLTIQRFAWTAGQARRTVQLLSSAPSRTRLATEIAAEVKARHIDGVNLDFEPLPAEVRDAFTGFVRELRLELDAVRRGSQITFDTTAAVSDWDLAALTGDDAADAAFVMGYDYRVAGDPIAGSVDPIASTTADGLARTLDVTLAQVPPEHVILGLPWYGRAWSTASDGAGSATLDQGTYGNSVAVEYGDAIAQARQYGRNYDATEASAWTVYRKQDCATCPETWRQLWYDDVDSMQAKQKLAVERGLRGLGIWALGYDHALPEAWATLKLTLGGGADTSPPTGTARVDPGSISGRHGGLPVVNGSLTVALTADDGPQGSGVAFSRVSASADVASDGSLASGITYPSAPSQVVPLADPRLGSGFAAGRAMLSVQWRDVTGNWSAPGSVAFWLDAPVSTLPAPLPSAGD